MYILAKTLIAGGAPVSKTPYRSMYVSPSGSCVFHKTRTMVSPWGMNSAVQAVPHLPAVQEAVAKLCLAWWQAGAAGRETLVLQTLPYALVKALTSGEHSGITNA